MPALLTIRDLRIHAGNNQLLHLPLLTLNEGELHGVIGESGSGKSLTLFVVLGLIAPQLKVQGSVVFQGKEIINLSPNDWLSIRGKQIGMVFQEPMSALNPQMRCGKQLLESALIHQPNKEKAQALVDAANDSGGRDNISVILAYARSKPVRKGILSRMLGK